MLIVSKYKDYYDSAVGMGVDKSIVYERKEEDIHDKYFYFYEELGYKQKYSGISGIYEGILRSFSTGYGWYDNDFDSMVRVIGFCGKLYPFFEFIEKEKDSEGLITKTSEFVFDRDKIIDRLKLKKGRKAELINEWDLLVGKDPIEIHRKFNTPVFIHKHGRRNDVQLTINPVLKDYKFVRVFDPYTAFQEIQMFISGVLSTGDDVDQIKMNEKDKVNQHGFDEKYGFRTRPKK